MQTYSYIAGRYIDIPDLKAGDVVTYSDVNLRNYRGSVEYVRDTENSIVVVRWTQPNITVSDEWAPNLIAL